MSQILDGTIFLLQIHNYIGVCLNHQLICLFFGVRTSSDMVKVVGIIMKMKMKMKIENETHLSCQLLHDMCVLINNFCLTKFIYLNISHDHLKMT